MDDGCSWSRLNILQACAFYVALRFQVTYEFNDKPMAEVVTNEVVARLYQENAESLGVSFLDPLDPRVIAASGSTDMGNVTQTVPGIHAYFQITSSCRAHTREFATAAGRLEILNLNEFNRIDSQLFRQFGGTLH